MRMPLPSAPTRGTRQTTVAVTDSESQHGGDSEGLRLPGRQSWVRGSPRGGQEGRKGEDIQMQNKNKELPDSSSDFSRLPFI